jgi:hypothetical protein
MESHEAYHHPSVCRTLHVRFHIFYGFELLSRCLIYGLFYQIVPRSDMKGLSEKLSAAPKFS